MRIIEPLDARHDRDAFDCGKPELNDYLRRIARQHQEKGVSRTFVRIDDANPHEIIGFYTLTVCEVETAETPAKFAKRLPRRIPGARLGRLAVDRRHQRAGHGEYLLLNALERIADAAQEIGITAVFVDAKGEEAREFYLAYGFQTLPGQRLQLFFPIQDVRKLFENS